MKSAPLACRPDRGRTVIPVGPVAFGRDRVLIAGPCSVESEAQIRRLAAAVRRAGAHLLRGGVFKPRTSPYSFQGLGLAGLKLLRDAGRAAGLPVVTEVLDPRDVAWMSEFADVLQVGARNMQNFSLLKEVGRIRLPVILKRGLEATIEEWLCSAEYILQAGNPNVILCERGIRTFEPFTRNTLDLSAVAAIRELSHLPVIVDPSHGIGRPSLIPAVSLAAVAGGADGLMLEVHDRPAEALSDGSQAISPQVFATLARRVRTLSRFLDESPPDSDAEAAPADLAGVRRQIELLDGRILDLLERRMQAAVGSRRFKTRTLDPDREREVLGYIRHRTAGLLSTEFCEHLFTEIMAESRRLQEAATVPPGPEVP